MGTISKAAAIGGGVIGAGWVARLVLNGIDVSIFDPDPEADRKVGEVMNATGSPQTSPPVGLDSEITIEANRMLQRISSEELSDYPT